jgi:2'-5' RNA ligase
MNTINDYYDLVILPDEKVSNYCINLSKQISKQIDSEGVLGEKENHPHISILHLAVNKKNLKELERRIISLAEKQNSFDVTISGLSVMQSVLFLNVTPKVYFSKLFKNIFPLTDDLLDNSFDYKSVWRYADKPIELQKNIDKYKTPFAGKYFVPHISLLHFNNKEEAEKAKDLVKLKKISFRAKKMSLCKLGEHHTCQDIVFEYPLN